jgi:hypothetical protein
MTTEHLRLEIPELRAITCDGTNQVPDGRSNRIPKLGLPMVQPIICSLWLGCWIQSPLAWKVQLPHITHCIWHCVSHPARSYSHKPTPVPACGHNPTLRIHGTEILHLLEEILFKQRVGRGRCNQQLGLHQGESSALPLEPFLTLVCLVRSC